jgi:hypothetical protein
MKLSLTLKYTAITILAFIVGLAMFIVTDPKWCYDEHLRHTFNKRVLSTPARNITDEEYKSIRWGVEYSGFSDKLYADAYTTQKNRKIIRIHPSAAPALTVGFHIDIEIDAPLDNLEVEYDENSTVIQIRNGLNIKADKISNYSYKLYDGNRGDYNRYNIRYFLNNETIEQLKVKSGDVFSGSIPFSIDGELYTYTFSTILRHEKRKHGCFGVPGMP